MSTLLFPILLALSTAQGDSFLEVKNMVLTLSSQSFANGEAIPRRHTCEGEDISPELQWSSLPPGAKSLALIVDDPDAPDPAAPKRTWVHWVLYNIPSGTEGLRAAVSSAELPKGTLEGQNDWGRTGYGGPCPPVGRHRYFHKLYALDSVLPDLKSPTKAALEKAMAGHVIGQAELVGTYQKGR
jgi:Raf kinase inhibitor-like YbhB/YbcL family protein